MPNLPESFTDRMKELLNQEYPAFIKTYDEPRTQGLRVNTLKISLHDLLAISPFKLKPVPWAREGFYYNDHDQPGKHPYHEAGLYYIQEPSAMAVVTLMDPQPGEKVLDLCAAPGGKSTHIASRLDGKGLLVSNEIHPSRAKILSQNIERMGIKNCVVTNEPPHTLAQKFEGYFDRVLVDAPCSGEGMFRKDPDACRQWNPENVASCARRQLEILKAAAKTVIPEGILVYSTCTFSPQENEQVVDSFLEDHKDFEVIESFMFEGFAPGRPEWSITGNNDLSKTIRLWPHYLEGEGHYIAILKKIGGKEYSLARNKRDKKENLERNLAKHYSDFANSYLNNAPQDNLTLFGIHLYVLPPELPSMEKIKTLRPGWHLGTFKKNRFEPSHALAISLKADESKKSISLPSDSNQLISYLKGEPLTVQGENGWTLVLVDGYSLGWGKLVSGTLKNHYPKGLRWSGV